MRVRATLLVVPAYLLGAVLFTWPLLLAWGRAIPTTGILLDARMQAFLLGWDWHALRTAPLALFHPPIFHPERNVLTYMDHMLGETLVASPWLALSGSVAPAYNALVWFSFAASGWAVYSTSTSAAESSGTWLL